MVLTRLSHFGEVCPLSDHSYSDPASPSTSVAHLNQKRLQQALLGVKALPSSSPAGLQQQQQQHLSDQDEAVIQIHVFDLPNEILEKMFSYLTYKKIGEIRLTCKRFEQIGSSILNTTFQRLQNQMLQRFQTIKGQMPRRESARRTHPLARESDIVETLHMRLTLLQMSFGKHIERKHCCFFAGDILDEVYRLLAYIKSTPNLDRAYIVTDELFDLSTMAMEYFKEHIEPRLPEITCFGSEFLDITSRFSEECSVRSPSGSGRSSEPEDEMPEHEALPQSNMVLRKRIKRIRQGMRKYNTQLAAMKRELKSCKGKLTDQHKQVMEYATRMDEYDKKFEESSRKFSTVLQELNKCKTELQYWRSKSPAQPLLCFGCGQPFGEGSGVVGRGGGCGGNNGGCSGGSSQQYPPGVLMQGGGEDALVYMPLAAAPAPECVEKVQPLSLLTARDDSRDRWHHPSGGSVRSMSEPLSRALPPCLPPTASCAQLPLPPPPPTLFQSISSSCSQPTSPETSQNVATCPMATISNPVRAARPMPISQLLVGTSAVATSPTMSTSSATAPPPPSPHPLPPPPLHISAHSLPAPPPPPATSSHPSSILSQQPYSAFHSCVASHGTDHRWYGSQEHAEDLSMSRPSKLQLCLEDDREFFCSLKRRGSDDDSDYCDSDDTVGRRVKERKRIKLDVF